MPTKFKATKPKAEIEAIAAGKDPIIIDDIKDIDCWIDDNIVDIEDIRGYLKRLTRIVRSINPPTNKYQKS
jgi:hypothetical protein